MTSRVPYQLDPETDKVVRALRDRLMLVFPNITLARTIRLAATTLNTHIETEFEKAISALDNTVST